jgi:hypothetical protein
MPETESLYVSSIDVQPVTVDSWSDLLDPDDGIDGATYWETFDYELGDDTHTLLSERGYVSGVIVDGTLYRDHDDYLADWEADHDGAPPIETKRDWDALMETDPGMWGSAGPMMNYWYPVDSITDDDDAVSAAVAIRDLPLCVVRVGNDYGMALTGGGMDLSWDICAAYVATGNLPPAHFADLPSFAGGHGERPEIAAAMIRSLTITAERAQRALERLQERFPGLPEGSDQ